MRDRPVFYRKTLTVPGDLTSAIYTEDFTAFADARRITETSCRFFVRYRSGIGPDTHRIVWDGAIWTITSAIHDRKKTTLTIESDLTQLIEATHLQSETREYVEGVPTVRPQS